MQKASRHSGFTLIELMIVIVIIGIICTSALLAFGDFGAARRARLSAEQFIAYIQLLEERALLQTQTLGVRVNAKGYDTYLFQDAQWRLLSMQHVFKSVNFPSSITVTIDKIGGQNHNAPNIMINPSGNITPFTLYFGTQTTPRVFEVKGYTNGELHLENHE